VIDARQAPAAFHLGAALWLIEPGERALDFFRLAVGGRPREFEYRSRYGQALDQIGRYSEAALEFKAASELRPADAENWSRLGLALHRTGDRPGALQAYTRAIRLDPWNQDTRNQLSVIALELGQTERSLTATISATLVILREDENGTAVERYAVSPVVEAESGSLRYDPGLAYKQQDKTDTANAHRQGARQQDHGTAAAHYAAAEGGR
jgi:Flp pilus assembly protein TadD